jgi:hypothetical protein
VITAAVMTCKGRYPSANLRIIKPKDLTERGFEPAAWSRGCGYRIALKDRNDGTEYLYDSLLLAHCELTGTKPPLRKPPGKKQRSGYHARQRRTSPYMGQGLGYDS